MHEELNDLPHEVGVLVSIPKDATKPNKEAMLDEFDNPTPLPHNEFSHILSINYRTERLLFTIIIDILLENSKITVDKFN